MLSFPSLEIPLSSLNNDVDDEDDEPDLHLCGKCKSSFGDINDFVAHKKKCKKIPKKPDKDFNLATDEAAVISLLANQLSSQNSQSRTCPDDLDQFTLVFKDDELDAIVPDPLPLPLTPQKKHEKIKLVSSPKKANKSLIKDIKCEKKNNVCSVIGCSFKTSHPKDLVRHLRTHTGLTAFINYN